MYLEYLVILEIVFNKIIGLLNTVVLRYFWKL